MSQAGLALTGDIIPSLPHPTKTNLPFHWRRSPNIHLDGPKQGGEASEDVRTLVLTGGSGGWWWVVWVLQPSVKQKIEMPASSFLCMRLRPAVAQLSLTLSRAENLLLDLQV